MCSNHTNCVFNWTQKFSLWNLSWIYVNELKSVNFIQIYGYFHTQFVWFQHNNSRSIGSCMNLCFIQTTQNIGIWTYKATFLYIDEIILVISWIHAKISGQSVKFLPILSIKRSKTISHLMLEIRIHQKWFVFFQLNDISGRICKK
jgi:hypothetical protein